VRVGASGRSQREDGRSQRAGPRNGPRGTTRGPGWGAPAGLGARCSLPARAARAILRAISCRSEPLAQLVEHRPFKPRVLGSIPRRLTLQHGVRTGKVGGVLRSWKHPRRLCQQTEPVLGARMASILHRDVRPTRYSFLPSPYVPKRIATMSKSGPISVYVASSWRNERQPAVVVALRRAGFNVYDFRNPTPDQQGFAWSTVDPGWKTWSPAKFREGLAHPAAQIGFQRDMNAMHHADTTVLVLPCGRSAHLELGYAVGLGHATFVLCDTSLTEPELMYLMADKICLTTEELVQALREVQLAGR
jgi:hypothetical protein